MAVIYLEPKDLLPAQAVRVLDFLNRAQTPQEIAARIEFPDELDIGVQLGRRLLDRRAQLGGRYTNLTQVADVPLIGPERFTEICAGILGLDPRQWVQDPGLFAERYRELLAQFDELQRRLQALESAADRVLLDLVATPQTTWLGRSVQLVVYARDLQDRPLAGRSVTLEASTGTLVTAQGLAVQRGRAITVVTGADGSARINLEYTPIEPLTADQQAALNAALARLDATADSPNLIRNAFLAIAVGYQDERDHSLRAALDIYARQWKATFFDQVNASNLGFYFPIETCVVRADCHATTGSSSSLVQAVVAVQWKNWVGAWFEYLTEFLTQQSGLSARFTAAKQRGKASSRLVDDVIGEAHSFVAAQKGLAAEWVSQRAVTFAVHDFLGRDVDDVDETTQSELFANLEAAAGQLTAANRGAVAMVRQTRADLSDRIGRISVVNQSILDQVLAQASQVEAISNSLVPRLNAFDRDFAIFNTNFSQFNTNFGQFQTSFNEFTVSRTQISRQLTNTQTELAELQTSRTEVARELEAIKIRLR